MSDGSSVDHDDQKQALSALMDGEADAGGLLRACAAWRIEADAREAWHTYHLIGDVMRSQDVPADADYDAAFLARLRTRLAQEPVVLAPVVAATPVPEAPAVQVANGAAAGGRRRAWAAPFAVAAGFMVVAGALVVTRVVVPGPGAPGATTLAVAMPSQQVAPQAVSASASLAADDNVELATAADTQPDVKIVRDARLDRYLAAHRQYGYTVAVPGVTLRNAAAIAPER